AAVEAPEDLLERVVVAFAVSTRQVGVGTRRWQHEGRVLDLDLIRPVAMSDPQVVGTFAVPRHTRLRAVNLEPEIILAARAHLAGGETPASPLAHAEHHRAEVFGVDGHVFGLPRGRGAKRSHRLLRTLARL